MPLGILITLAFIIKVGQHLFGLFCRKYCLCNFNVLWIWVNAMAQQYCVPTRDSGCALLRDKSAIACKEDMDIFSFELTGEEMAVLSAK